jgi:radical SAM protein
MIAARPGGQMPGSPPRFDLSRGPLLVFYEVTQACDLVCTHCRACAQTEPHPHELRPSESRLLVDQLREFPHPPMLILTGGDPLKRPDIFELITYARSRDLQVSITPSATPLVTREAISRLREAGISRMAISIDGADAQTHDATRGVPGSFERSREILEQARQAGIATQVNTTITPGNVKQIDDLARLIAGHGIVMWSVFFLVPVGRAAEAPRLSSHEYEDAFARLWRQSQRQEYAIKTTEAPHYRRFVIQHQVARRKAHGEDATPRPFLPQGINDGKGVMFVGHTGLIHPSGFLPITCGLFPRNHVVDIYQRSPIFQGLRDANRLEGKCRECEFRTICGGSRARAYALTGNPYAPEPDCEYAPAARTED